MLKFYYGTELEKLADRLLKELDKNPPSNPLKEEIFVVQNHGIGQWLSLYMARKKGIAANLKFEFPSERLWSLIRLMNADIPEDLPSDRGPMTWSLMQLFRDEEFLADFENIRTYIQDSSPDQQAFRSWKLSSKIADVFDQYLIYRPQMIMDWQNKDLRQFEETERWQARLWKQLIKHWQKDYNNKWLHRAQLQQQLFESLDTVAFDDTELPERILVFGVSSMPPVVIKTLVKLSKLTQVHFYHLTVDPSVKNQHKFSHPLLQSLGKESTELMSLLSGYVKSDPEVKKNMGWQEVSEDTSATDTAFAGVQLDLKMDKSLKGRTLNVPAIDKTIQVHSCHSPMREVEVVYDQLLALLDKDDKLHPDDILIMTPDIETYAPMIEAVFASPDEGQPEIPFSIADRGIKGDYPAIETFLNILALCESRFKITDVLDLLDAAPVQQAFDFSEEDLNKIQRWVGDNRVRWGIGRHFKQKMELPATDNFTWQAGRDRMLLGYVMKPADDRLFDGIFPYDEIEQSDDATLVGRFSYFLRKLFEVYQWSDEMLSVEEWEEKLQKIVSTFLPENREFFREVSTIRDVIEQLNKLASLGGFNDKVRFGIVRNWLQEQLQRQSTGGGRIGRGVTFSSLMPMRSIPFKMIGMMGMSEGAFPRSKIPVEFDLLHHEARPGDPVQADEDRNLLLENLLSARKYLYFSFTGQSNRQDTEFPPSVVLKEFMDFLEEYYDLPANELMTKHRLQSFSPHYFKKGNLFSFSQTQQKISRLLTKDNTRLNSFFDNELPEPDDEWKKITVNDLVTFFQHPAKFILQNRLGIYLGEEDVLIEEREPFALANLDKYRVEQALLDRFLKDDDLESYQQVMQARDYLPEGWVGEREYQQKMQEAQAFGREIRQQLDREQLPDCDVDLQVDGFRITGKLTDIYPQAKITYRFGKARAKDKVDCWIQHVLLQLVKQEGLNRKSCLFSWHKSSLKKDMLWPVENPEEKLKELLNWYWQGVRRPLQFFCKSSYAYAEQLIKKGKDEQKGVAKAIKKWEPGWNGYPGEGDDAYHKLVTSGKSPFEKSGFKSMSKNFWAPYFEVLNLEDK